MRSSSFFVFLFLGCLSHSAAAQEFFPSRAEYDAVQASGRSSLTLDLENDSLLLKRDDGFYTSGNHLILKRNLTQAHHVVTYGWQLGQDLYTASNINLRPSQLSRVDHPYAGWLYVGAFREHQLDNGKTYRLGLDFGCFGPCAGGEWTQTHLHRLLNQPLPQAWSTQLKQEWGAVVSADISSARWQWQEHGDVAVRAGVRLGNIFDDAKVDVLWRWGRLNALETQNAGFAFARGALRAVAYNATVQGAYFNRQTSAVHPKRLVPEVELGYQWRDATWAWSASVLRRGSEVAELSQAKAAQNFAKIQLLINWD